MTTWTSTQLALALNLTRARIGQLIKAEVLPEPTAKGHDPFTAIPAYLAYLNRPAESTTLSEARKKKVEVETKIRVLELRRREGEVVEAAVVDRRWFQIGREIREGLDNVPSRIAPLVANESDQEKCFQIIKKEIDQILEVLCAEKTPDPGAGATRPRPAARRDPRDVASRRGSA